MFRAHMESESTATRSLFRTILMHAFHLLVYVFSSRTVRDTQCGFKLFTRAAASRVCLPAAVRSLDGFLLRKRSHLKVFPVLHIERWAFDVELIYLCELWMIPIAEVKP